MKPSGPFSIYGPDPKIWGRGRAVVVAMRAVRSKVVGCILVVSLLIGITFFDEIGRFGDLGEMRWIWCFEQRTWYWILVQTRRPHNPTIEITDEGGPKSHRKSRINMCFTTISTVGRPKYVLIFGNQATMRVEICLLVNCSESIADWNCKELDEASLIAWDGLALIRSHQLARVDTRFPDYVPRKKKTP